MADGLIMNLIIQQRLFAGIAIDIITKVWYNEDYALLAIVVIFLPLAFPVIIALKRENSIAA